MLETDDVTGNGVEIANIKKKNLLHLSSSDLDT